MKNNKDLATEGTIDLIDAMKTLQSIYKKDKDTQLGIYNIYMWDLLETGIIMVHLLLEY